MNHDKPADLVLHHCQVQVAEFVRAVERRCYEDDMTDTKTIRDVIDLFINNSDGFGIKVENYLDQTGLRESRKVINKQYI